MATEGQPIQCKAAVGTRRCAGTRFAPRALMLNAHLCLYVCGCLTAWEAKKPLSIETVTVAP
eukprot:COSAG01_NODE_30455_length_615_cov_2.591085_1_plen_61_part_01